MMRLTADNQGDGVFIHPIVTMRNGQPMVVDAETGRPIKATGCTGHHWITQIDEKNGTVKVALLIEGITIEGVEHG